MSQCHIAGNSKEALSSQGFPSLLLGVSHLPSTILPDPLHLGYLLTGPQVPPIIATQAPSQSKFLPLLIAEATGKLNYLAIHGNKDQGTSLICLFVFKETGMEVPTFM